MSLSTGQSSAAVFSVTALAFCFTEMDLGEETMPAVNTSCLDAVGFETYIPGDLAEPGTVTMPFYHDTEQDVPSTGALETLTITLPLAPGQQTAATWSGSGFISGYTRSTLVKNEVINGSITFQFDGYTGPTFTPAVATP